MLWRGSVDSLTWVPTVCKIKKCLNKLLENNLLVHAKKKKKRQKAGKHLKQKGSNEMSAPANIVEIMPGDGMELTGMRSLVFSIHWMCRVETMVQIAIEQTKYSVSQNKVTDVLMGTRVRPGCLAFSRRDPAPCGISSRPRLRPVTSYPDLKALGWNGSCSLHLAVSAVGQSKIAGGEGCVVSVLQQESASDPIGS